MTKRSRPITAFTWMVLALAMLLASAVSAQDNVTKTFRLTITGDVPARTAFSVLYGSETEREVVYLCGPREGTPDCSMSMVPTTDGSKVQFVDVTVPRGTELHVTWRVHLNGSEDGTAFHEDVETLNEDTVNTASYSFAATPTPAPATPTPVPTTAPTATPPANTVDVHFRLTVADAPCPNATYFAVFGVPQGEFFSAQLTDTDGDGIYTAHQSVTATPLYISIQQGIGTVQEPPSDNLLPGQPRSTVRDFGLVTPTQGMMFEASVTGCPGGTAEEVTKTFRLTITGDVPARTAFSVLYGSETEREVVYLCGPREGTPDCSMSMVPTTDGSKVQFVDVTVPRGTELHVTWRVHLNGSEDGTAFHEDVETLNEDTVNTASYSFAATPTPAPATPTPVPTTAPTATPVPPVQLPDTGAGTGLPVAVVAAGLLVAGGFYLRRRVMQRS